MDCLLFTGLASINIITVLVCAVIVFILGSLWFSPVLFGNIWRDELVKHNVIITPPTPASLKTKMALTFMANLVAVVGMAFLVHMTGAASLCSAVQLGLVVAIGSVMTSFATSYVWLSKSLTLLLIDSGYPAVASIMAAVILSLWR